MEMGAGINMLTKSEFKNEFEINDEENDCIKLKKTDMAVNYLQVVMNQNDSNELLKKSEHMNALNYVLHIMNCYSTDNPVFLYEKLDNKIQIKLVEIMRNLTKTFYKNLTKKDYLSNEEIDLNFKLLFNIIKKLSELTSQSKTLCLNLNNTSTIQSFLYFIDDFNLISTNPEEEFDDFDDKNVTKKLNCTHLSLIFLNLSKYCNKSDWINLNAVESLIKLIEKLKFNVGFQQWYLFLTIENIRSTDISNIRYDSKYTFDFNPNEEIDQVSQKRNLGIRYLKFLNDTSSIVNNEQSMNIIYYLSCINDQFETISDDLHEEFMGILISLTKYLFESIINLLEFNELSEKSGLEEKISRNKLLKRNFYFFQNVTKIIQTYSNSSIKFCIKFNKTKDSIKTFIEFIRNDQLSDYMVNNKNHSSLMLLSCYEYLLMCVLNLSRVNYKFKKLWEGLDSVNVLVCFSQKIGSISSSLMFVVYVIISNIASDKQIDTLKEIKVAIKNITTLIIKCADGLEGNNHIKRTHIQIDENEEFFEVISIKNENQEWHLIELTDALYHLSVNDNIKLEIYHTFQMKDVLKRIIYKGNEIEKEYSLRCLYQLCFDDQIASDLASDNSFIQYMKQMSKKNDFKRKKLNQNSKGILFTLANKSNLQIDIFGTDETQIQSNSNIPGGDIIDNKHIMISYNRDSRDVCLKIKTELEKLGYNVWIDVEDISGSSLESMAEAIENSICVLICMTEKYKLSSNCRLEAEYTVQLNKPIVPLILQASYKPDGWLGIILGSKMFINFKKYDFEECIRRLKVEITNVQRKSAKQLGRSRQSIFLKSGNPYLNQHNIRNNKQEDKSEIIDEHANEDKSVESQIQFQQRTSQTSNYKDIKNDWKEEDVETWLNEKNFNPIIAENLKPCNGKILYQLYLMFKTSPEFFYWTLRADSNNKISLKDIAIFSYELSSLFNEENN